MKIILFIFPWFFDILSKSLLALKTLVLKYNISVLLLQHLKPKTLLPLRYKNKNLIHGPQNRSDKGLVFIQLVKFSTWPFWSEIWLTPGLMCLVCVESNSVFRPERGELNHFTDWIRGGGYLVPPVSLLVNSLVTY